MLKKAKKSLRALLVKSQKYTKTDNIYLAKGSFWLGLSQAITMATAIVLSILWARFIPPDIYGQYKFILAFTELFAIFTLAGMEQVLVGAVARGYEGTAKAMIKTRLKFSGLAVLIGFALSFYYWINHNNVLAISLLLAGILSPFIESLTCVSKYLEGKKRFDLEAKSTVVKTFFSGLFTVLAIFLTKNVIWLVFTYFASRFIITLLVSFWIFKINKPNNKIEKGTITFGKHLSFVAALNRLAGQLDKILVFHYLGAAELAVYSFAVLIPDNLGGLSKNFQQLISPKLAKTSNQKIKQTVKEKTLRFFLFLSAIVLFYILLAPLAFKIFFPAYSNSVFYTQIYSLGLLFGAGLIPSTTFIVKNRTKIIYAQNLAFSLSKMVLIFLGLYYFGLLGLVIAIVLARFTQTVFAFFLLKYL